jgi:DNA repair protein RadD
MKTPRPDQERAIQAAFDFYATGQTKDRDPLIGMPTGYGKSLVIAEICKRAFHYWPNTRALVATHVKELIEQNRNTLLAQWPTAPLGICSAGLGQRETFAPLIIGGIKSLWNSRETIGSRHFMVVDEAHLVSPDAETQYRKFISYMRSLNPYFTVIGLTATLYRTGSGPLSEAEGGIFTEVIFDCTSLHEFNRILDEGWLCRLVPKRPQAALSAEGVGWAGDDFNQSQAQEAVDKPDLTLQCCRETIAQKAIEKRRSCLIFAQGVTHAEHIAECLQALGHYAATVHDKTSKEDRESNITSFKNGTLPYLINNNVLTTGFDFPDLDMISVMRLIGSPGLWVQILGRGTRPMFDWCQARGFSLNTAAERLWAISQSPKQNCLVLDFAGNRVRLGPINDPVLPKRRGRKSGPGIAPIKICPECGTYNYAAAVRCENPSCDVEFSREQKLFGVAGEEELIRSSEKKYETHDITSVTYSKYEKTGTPPIMRVTYYEGPIHAPIKEHICFEHTGYGRKKAVEWWLAHSDLPVPLKTDDALAQQAFFKEPKQLRVRVEGTQLEVIEYIW